MLTLKFQSVSVGIHMILGFVCFSFSSCFCPADVRPVRDISSTGTIGTSIQDEFLLEVSGAHLPVAVEGNSASGVFLIFLHGGPGSSGLIERIPEEDNPFDAIGDSFAVVFYDQRCSGSTPDPCGNETLTVAQFVEDLDALITDLFLRYGDNIQIFLMGHSWGGSLGIAYLAEQERKARIQAWIEVDGGHNVPAIAIAERERILELGEQQIGLQNNVLVWRTLIRGAQEIDLASDEGFLEMNRLSRSAEDLMRAVDSVQSNTRQNNNCIQRFRNRRILQDSRQTVNALMKEFAVLSLSSVLPDIRIPTLLLWGKFDVRVPVTFGASEFELYGSTEKRFIVSSRSAHFPFRTERKEFAEEVVTFIHQFKR